MRTTKDINDYLKRNKVERLSKRQALAVSNLIVNDVHLALQEQKDLIAKNSVSRKEQMRVDLSISIQRLVESNARLAQALEKALDLNR